MSSLNPYNGIATSRPSLDKHMHVNPHIRIKWVTFSPGCQVKLTNAEFVILSNIAVTNNTDDCFIRGYRSI